MRATSPAYLHLICNLYRPIFACVVGIGVLGGNLDKEASAQIIVRSGNLNTIGQLGTGLADISYNGGSTWSRIAVGMETSTLYGNALANGNYRANPTDITGRLGVSGENGSTAAVTARTITNVGLTPYEGNVANTQSLGITTTTIGFTRLFFSFAAPSSLFTVSSGFFRADNAAYNAILNYATPANQRTINTFALNTATSPSGSSAPPIGNAFRVTTNVPSSVQFSDTRQFAGGGTQNFSLVYYNNSGISNGNFEVQFQPVPAPPAAISLGIGGLVGLLGTGIGKLRARHRKHTARKA